MPKLRVFHDMPIFRQTHVWSATVMSAAACGLFPANCCEGWRPSRYLSWTRSRHELMMLFELWPDQFDLATWAQGNTNSWKCGAMSLERHVLRVPPVCLLQGSTRDEPSQAMTSAAWVKSLGTPQKRMVVTNNQHPWSHGLLISEP